MGQFFHRLKQGLPWHYTSEGIATHPGLLLLVSSLLAFTSIALVLLHAEQRRYTSDLLRQGTILTQVLRQAAGHYIAIGHTDELQHLVRGIQQHTLVYCAIVDANNRLVAQVGTPPPEGSFPPPTARRALEGQELTITTAPEPASGQTIWHFSSPMVTPEAQGGTLRFGIIAESMHTMFLRLIPSLALVALVISLLAAVVYYFLRVLLRPIWQLNAQLNVFPMVLPGQSVETVQHRAIGTFVQRWQQVMTQTQTTVETIKEANFALELTSKVLGYEKRRLEITLDRLSDAILITDSSGKVIFANRMTARLLNTAVERIVGRALQECFREEKLSALLTENDALGHDVKVRSTEICFETYQAETFKATVSSIIDNDEKFIGSFLLIRNITQQKIAEQARSEFISAVSHELKNPLSTIKSYVEILINQVIDDHTTKYEFYNTINDETDRMTRLIDNLLNLSKIELGLLHIKPTRVRIRQLLTDCFQAMESQAFAKGIAFELHLAEKLSALEVDKDLLGVVIMNLLSNALKYTPEGGEVTVAAEETDEELVMHVRDSGIGIPEADLSRIFERFYRGQNSDKAAGSGLGLALAQQIMYLHGGALTVTSQQHQGSQFTLTLPKSQHMPQLISTGKQSHEDSDC